MDKYINDLVYSNDASSSSFGWNFQTNAAIFLCFHFVDSLKDITVESKKQDIEITLNDSSKIYAQAKSPSSMKKCVVYFINAIGKEESGIKYVQARDFFVS